MYLYSVIINLFIVEVLIKLRCQSDIYFVKEFLVNFSELEYIARDVSMHLSYKFNNR